MIKPFILGIIPARSGSKRVPGKNVKLLNGKPLITYTFETAKLVKSFTRLIVSTNDSEVIELAQQSNIEVPFQRPEKFANDVATDRDWIAHAVDELTKQGHNVDYVVILRPTQPIRSVNNIDEAVKKIINLDADSVRSLTKVSNHPYWMKKLEGDFAVPFIDTGKPDEQLRSQDLPPLYFLNGVVDVINVRNLKTDYLYGKKMAYIILEESRVVDIDTEEDFKKAEYLLNKCTSKEATKKKIVLIGARHDGHAGVIVDALKKIDQHEIVGFIDENEELHHTTVLGFPVLGDMANIPQNATGFFVCTGNNQFREKCHLQLKGLEPINVIHPSAVISDSATLGKGVYIGPQATITHNAQIGDGVIINTAASIDHDNIIEDFVNICPGTHTSGRVIIRTKAFLGTGTKVINDITIGENSFVCAGSLVITDVPAHCKVFGVPARLKK